jgi:UDP-N-acetyl-D-glucosamine dehydrogenase
MIRVCVVGLGYVGLSTAIHAAEAGYLVFGLDTNIEKVKKLNSGSSLIEDISDIRVANVIKQKLFSAHTNIDDIVDPEVLLICVPTPLTEKQLPDLSYFSNSIISIAPLINAKTLLVVESTIEPGTTRNLVVELLEEYTSLNRSELLIAFSPERIDPGNLHWNLKNTPKIVAGINDKSKNLAVEFFSTFIDQVVSVESLEIAETAKLLENTFRLINISFINELAMFCAELKIDVNQVIKAASSKPYGYMPFYSSLGVGGHCIPVDPVYLSNKAKQIGATTRFIDLALRINRERPEYFIEQAKAMVGNLENKRILVIGIAFKSNISDMREAPAKNLIFGLRENLALVYWHDDLVKKWNQEESVELTADYDLAIIATPHDYLNLSLLGDVPILDTRGTSL